MGDMEWYAGKIIEGLRMLLLNDDVSKHWVFDKEAELQIVMELKNKEKRLQELKKLHKAVVDKVHTHEWYADDEYI